MTGLHNVASWAVPQLIELAAKDKEAKPSFLVTNSALPRDPIPQMFSLSLTKAAQYNLVQSLSKTYASEKIHFGIIMVGGGPVSENEETRNPTNIAQKAWEFFENEWATNLFQVEIW